MLPSARMTGGRSQVVGRSVSFDGLWGAILLIPPGEGARWFSTTVATLNRLNYVSSIMGPRLTSESNIFYLKYN